MPTLTTHFATPERASQEAVADQHQSLKWQVLVQQLLDSSPEPILVLNQERQVVLANDKMTALLGVTQEAQLGRRPGEIFDCIHAWENEAGCGTSEFCKECGAVQAICASQESSTPQWRECRMSCSGEFKSSLIYHRIN